MDDIDVISVESSDESAQETCRMTEECIKQDIKVQHAKEENINVMQATNIDQNLRSSFASGDVDNVLSGESLYKTFTFEQTSDEDIEKCIAFWTTVMQKNLEPIKCSIIETTETKVQKTQVEKTPLVDKTEEINTRIKDAENKIHAHYKDMWMTVLKEIQRRKLDEVKTYAKTRCRICETGTALKDFSSTKDEIIELNEWEPEKNTGSQPPKKRHPLKLADCVCKPVVKSVTSTDSVNTVVSDRRYIPKDTNRYVLRDLINQKRKTGAYSRWRDNILEPCTCGADQCECNKNPAIVSIEVPDATCGCKQLQCECKLNTMENIVAEEVDSLLEESCTCGHIKCICKKSKTETVETRIAEATASTSTVSGGKAPSTFPAKDILNVGAPVHTNLVSGQGSIQKDSKVDGKKEGSNKGSCTTIKSLKCYCEKECHCEAPQADLVIPKKEEEGSKNNEVEKQPKKLKKRTKNSKIS